MNDPLRLLLVGPLPPPSGGMANQTRQLQRLLEVEGLVVKVVQTNTLYRPAWVAPLKGIRAITRLVPYAWRVFAQAGRADVVHVMANSGWAWHLFAAPAIRAARLRHKPVVVNYRGGLAGEFLAARSGLVRRTMRKADVLVVPSRFLQELFARHSMHAVVVPNVVDVELFRRRDLPGRGDPHAPHIVVARNLEHLYGNDTAIRALAMLRHEVPGAHMSIAGTGPEAAALRALAQELGLGTAVRFTGRLETAQMVALYQSADVVLNPSRADNTPNSVLEALACGVPVVSTNVGGVPFLVEHGRTAWLVAPDSPETMAQGLSRVLQDDRLRVALRSNGLELAKSCSWAVVKGQWLDLYRSLASTSGQGRSEPRRAH